MKVVKDAADQLLCLKIELLLRRSGLEESALDQPVQGLACHVVPDAALALGGPRSMDVEDALPDARAPVQAPPNALEDLPVRMRLGSAHDARVCLQQTLRPGGPGAGAADDEELGIGGGYRRVGARPSPAPLQGGAQTRARQT